VVLILALSGRFTRGLDLGVDSTGGWLHTRWCCSCWPLRWGLTVVPGRRPGWRGWVCAVSISTGTGQSAWRCRFLSRF